MAATLPHPTPPLLVLPRSARPPPPLNPSAAPSLLVPSRIPRTGSASHVVQRRQGRQGRRRCELAVVVVVIVSVRRCWVFAGFEIFAFGCRLAGGKKKEVKKETKLGMAYKKDDNFGEWYSEVR